MKKLKNTIYSIIAILILGGAGVAHKEIPNIKALLGNKIETKFNEAVKGTTSSSSDSSFDSKVTESVASQGMTNEIKASLGNVKFNGYGAYVVNDNKTNLNANVSSKPYAVLETDSLGRAYKANALVDKTTRQYKSREETGNGNTSWVPDGYEQRSNLKGSYRYAYNRGHLLGYAIVGGIKGFDASESNEKNIIAQTSWSNQASSDDNTGQNYYEGLVRKAQDAGKTVRYRVTAMYVGNEKVARGVHLEAKSKDGSLEFNVYVPNVQSNITIDYSTGITTPV